MEKVIGDIKDQRYTTQEYLFDDEAGIKAVECIPLSAGTVQERKNVSALDDLNVFSVASIP
jgi:hypothetical protein